MGVDRADQRHIGGIEPDDAVIAFVDVAVPNHRRGQDQVASFHLATPAVDDGHRAVRARGEADRRAGMTVRAGALAGVEHGEGREQRARGRGFRPEGRMRHDQRAAFDVVDRHFADRALQQRLDLAPAPDERRVLRLRLDRGNALVAVPQRMQIFGFELGDEGGSSNRSGCNVSHDGYSLSPRVRLRSLHSTGCCFRHDFGSLASIFPLSMMTCLIKTRGSTLSPLRNAASTSTPRRPHSTGFNSIVMARLSSFTARNAGGTPFMPVTKVLPLRLAALTACMAPSATSSLAA